MLLLVLSLLSVATAYPTGAPVETCHLWTAKHENHQPQASQPPYQLVFDGASVTLKGSKPFKGFFIQGQDEAGNPIGQFQLQGASAQTIDCSSPADSITHVDRNNKSSVTFKWQAPASFHGNVKFRAVVVQEHKTFWNNVFSNQVTIP